MELCHISIIKNDRGYKWEAAIGKLSVCCVEEFKTIAACIDDIKKFTQRYGVA